MSYTGVGISVVQSKQASMFPRHICSLTVTGGRLTIPAYSFLSVLLSHTSIRKT